MVHGRPAVVFFVVFEHGEIHHPQRFPFVHEIAVFRTVLFADFNPQCADGFVHHFGFVRAEENDVAVLRAGAFDDFVQAAFGQEFDDGRLQTAVFAVAQIGYIVHFDVGQTFRAVDADKLGVFVDFLAAEFRAVRHAQSHYAAAFHVGGATEHFEFFRFHQIGQLGEFQADAHVGFVGAVVEHGFGIGHAREVAQFHAQRVFEHLFGHAFGDVHDFILVQERGFQVDLGKFRLAVGAQVFVAEAFGDLVVAVETGHHQQLFEQLRRLRQREKFARMHAAGHEVVARAFGGGAGQHRRFDVDEALRVQITAHAHGYLITQAQIALHHGAAQVDDAVLQAHGFADVFVVNHKRRRGGGVQDFDFFGQNLDFAGHHFVVGSAFGAVAHAAGDAQNVFVAGGIGQSKRFGCVGVNHDLDDAFAVAQVDKNHTAVVAPAVHPAFDGYGLV